MRSDCSGLRYMALMGLMWLCNWTGIELLKAANFSASASGLLMIAPLAGISYIIQKPGSLGIHEAEHCHPLL